MAGDERGLLARVEKPLELQQPISDFTFPQEALVFTPTEFVVNFPNGDRERKIHTNTSYTPEERDRVKKFLELLKEQGIPVSPYVLSCATRFISRAREDVTKGLKLATTTQEWRTNFFFDGSVPKPMVDSMQHTFMQMTKVGVVYFCGRDYQLRPIMVIRASRIKSEWQNENDCNEFIKMMVFYMEFMIRYMLMPGVVENLSVLFDCDGIKVNWNTANLAKQINTVLSGHYNGRVFRFYVANPPWIMHVLMGIAKPLLTARQQAKLTILGSGADGMKPLHDTVASSQLEVKYGGSRPAMTRFYPIELPPGPFEPVISSGKKVQPDYNAIPDAHTVLTDNNNIGPIFMNDEELAGTRPQERLKLNVTDKRYCKMLRKISGLPSRETTRNHHHDGSVMEREQNVVTRQPEVVVYDQPGEVNAPPPEARAPPEKKKRKRPPQERLPVLAAQNSSSSFYKYCSCCMPESSTAGQNQNIGSI